MAGAQPLEQSFSIPDYESQICFTATGRSRRGGRAVHGKPAELVVPLGDFPRPFPTLQALVDRSGIGDRQHEFRNLDAVLLRGVGHVKPEFMLITRKRGPNLQTFPAITAQAQTHFLEIPPRYVAVLANTRERGMDLAEKSFFLRIQRPAQSSYQAAFQTAAVFLLFFPAPGARCAGNACAQVANCGG